MSKAFIILAVLSVLSLSDVVLGRILWAERGAKPVLVHPRRFGQEHPRVIDISIRAGNIGNFGSCSVPKIQFGAGFDGRKETSFEPVDKKSYNHGSAQVIDIISQFMCDTLVNSCGADQTARTTCASARAAADQKAQKTGAQADAFNAVFGIRTNFAAITPLDDHGDPVNGNTATCQAPSTTTPAVANFGKCTTPEIKFADGLDGRKETAFAPVDPVSYSHGSADNIGVITNFMCLALTNTCAANQAAKDLCNKAQAAANAAPLLTGAQADAFNAVFGKRTNFVSVTPIDNTGKPVRVSNRANRASHARPLRRFANLRRLAQSPRPRSVPCGG